MGEGGSEFFSKKVKRGRGDVHSGPKSKEHFNLLLQLTVAILSVKTLKYAAQKLTLRSQIIFGYLKFF